MFFLFRKKQSLTEANSDEIETAVHRLIELSTHDYGYYLFLVLSIIITTAGLLLQSSPVVIGGMIIAPLLTPILSCGLALLLVEMKGLVRSLAIIVLSVVTALVISAAMTITTLITDPSIVVGDFVPASIPPSLYLIIAFASGIAGAFAFVKKHLSSSIAGVAVSASLVPPLCSVGIGVALRNETFVQNSFTIFMLNVLGIIVASSLVFWILDFRKARKLEEKVVEKVEHST